MATDLPISGLPDITGSVATTDMIEVLDKSNTANHSTGENSQAQIQSLYTALPVFVAAGTTHAKGLVPDPGGTAHSTPYILGDDGFFHPITGPGLSYAGNTYTITGGGGGGTPGGTSGQIQVNASGSFGGADLTTLLDALLGSARGTVAMRGATAWSGLTPGAAGTFLKSGGTGADLVYGAGSGTTVPGGTLGQIQVNNPLGTFGGSALSPLIDAEFGNTQGTLLYRGSTGWAGLAPGLSGYSLRSRGTGQNLIWEASRKPFAMMTVIGTKQTGTALLSLFAGATFVYADGTTVSGAPLIPANRLSVGSVINFKVIGDLDIVASDVLTLTVKLGGLVIMTGLLGFTGTAATGRYWAINAASFGVQVAGASGSGRGAGQAVAYLTAGTSLGGGALTTAGLGNASASATPFDTTTALTFDVLLGGFSSAAAGNGIRVLEAEVFIDG